jgi:hypothetical protein
MTATSKLQQRLDKLSIIQQTPLPVLMKMSKPDLDSFSIGLVNMPRKLTKPELVEQLTALAQGDV